MILKISLVFGISFLGKPLNKELKVKKIMKYFRRLEY